MVRWGCVLSGPRPHGAFYVVHYPIAQRIALWYKNPQDPEGALACGLFVCPATDADALDTWLSGAEGLEAVRVAWGVVRDFATEALAKYEDFANPPNHPALFPRTPESVLHYPRPGDEVVDPKLDPDDYGITVRFATADRVYVDVRGGAGLGAAELHKSPSDGDYYLRSDWASVLSWVWS